MEVRSKSQMRMECGREMRRETENWIEDGLTLGSFFFVLLTIWSGPSSSQTPFLDAGPLEVGDLSLGLVGRDDGFPLSLVIRRRESDLVNTNPGDGCCGARVLNSRAGVDGASGGAKLADNDWVGFADADKLDLILIIDRDKGSDKTNGCWKSKTTIQNIQNGPVSWR